MGLDKELKEKLYSIKDTIQKGKPLKGVEKTIAVSAYEEINEGNRKAPTNCSSCPILYTILNNWFLKNPKPVETKNSKEATYKELRAKAIAKGYKGKKPSKEFLIEYLNK